MTNDFLYTCKISAVEHRYFTNSYFELLKKARSIGGRGEIYWKSKAKEMLFNAKVVRLEFVGFLKSEGFF